MENKCNLNLLLLNTQMVNFYFFNINCVKCCYKLNFFVLLHFFRKKRNVVATSYLLENQSCAICKWLKTGETEVLIPWSCSLWRGINTTDKRHEPRSWRLRKCWVGCCFSIPLSPIPGHFQNWKEHAAPFSAPEAGSVANSCSILSVTSWGAGVNIPIVHMCVHVLYTQPTPDGATVCSAHWFKPTCLPKALFCQAKQKKVKLSILRNT